MTMLYGKEGILDYMGNWNKVENKISPAFYVGPLLLGHTVDKSRLHFPKRKIRVRILAHV